MSFEESQYECSYGWDTSDPRQETYDLQLKKTVMLNEVLKGTVGWYLKTPPPPQPPLHATLTMNSAKLVEMSVTLNPDDQTTQSTQPSRHEATDKNPLRSYSLE